MPGAGECKTVLNNYESVPDLSNKVERDVEVQAAFTIQSWRCFLVPIAAMWAFIVMCVLIKSKREKEAAEDEERQAAYWENPNSNTNQ